STTTAIYTLSLHDALSAATSAAKDLQKETRFPVGDSSLPSECSALPRHVRQAVNRVTIRIMPLRHWLQLSLTEGIGPILISRLIDAAGSAEAACEAS